MNPYHFSPLGERDPKSGKHVFFISDVRQVGGEWGFDIIDRTEKMPTQKLRYPDRPVAEERRATIIEDFRGLAAGIDGAIHDLNRD